MKMQLSLLDQTSYLLWKGMTSPAKLKFGSMPEVNREKNIHAQKCKISCH